MSQLCSQLNPFSQFVIDEAVNMQSKRENDEERIWDLHEDLFKGQNQVINPEYLKKTSSQMYTIYKFYGDP